MMAWKREAREVLTWRDEAHARGRFTNLDDVPAFLIYAVHLLWALEL
jgi:hypothetical protein